MLRYMTGGESHGKALVSIVEGVPAGLKLLKEDIDSELSRRQRGFGRGERMKIEKDRVEILSGVRGGVTLGSPISLLIENKDWDNWKEAMDVAAVASQVEGKFRITRPRPGHADIAGGMKYGHRDLRNVLERASARETAARVAVGAIAKVLLREFGVKVVSYVVEVGGVKAEEADLSPDEIAKRTENSQLGCLDADAEKKMIAKIEEARERGDTVGGVFEVLACDLPVGLGGYVHWERRLDGRLAGALMSVQAIKGVEIGLGFAGSGRMGSQVHDEIFYEGKKFLRKTNNAGGLEGGVTNGEEVVLRAAVKPVSTLKSPLKSVDIETKKAFAASVERADVCVVPAAGVVGEAVVAIELARAFQEKFGGDSITEMKRNYAGYLQQVAEY